MIQFPGNGPVDTRVPGVAEALQSERGIIHSQPNIGRIVLDINYIEDEIFGINGTIVTCVASIVNRPVSEMIRSRQAELILYGMQIYKSIL